MMLLVPPAADLVMVLSTMMVVFMIQLENDNLY